MKLTREQRKKIINLFPRQRGNVKVDNNRFLDAIIYTPLGIKISPGKTPREIALQKFGGVAGGRNTR
jgi:hypothetical protein